jgi:hypothetical protein
LLDGENSLLPGETNGGRYWDRTSDPCVVSENSPLEELERGTSGPEAGSRILKEGFGIGSDERGAAGLDDTAEYQSSALRHQTSDLDRGLFGEFVASQGHEDVESSAAAASPSQ